jgi:hypothetical protein
MAEKETRVKSTMGGKSKDKPKKRKKKSKPIHSMTVRHAANGGYISTHHSQPEEEEEEGQQPEEHAISDLQGLHDHIDQHMAEAPQPQMQPAPVQQVTGT